MTLPPWDPRPPGDAHGARGGADHAARAVALARPAWMGDAACLEHPEVEFVPPQGRTEANAERARAVCAGCPAAEPCLAYALADDALLGIWAGTTTAERRAMRRARAA